MVAPEKVAKNNLFSSGESMLKSLGKEDPNAKAIGDEPVIQEVTEAEAAQNALDSIDDDTTLDGVKIEELKAEGEEDGEESVQDSDDEPDDK